MPRSCELFFFGFFHLQYMNQWDYCFLFFHSFLCCLTILYYFILLYESEWLTCFQMPLMWRNDIDYPYMCLLSYKAVILCHHTFDFLSSLSSSDVPHFQTILLSWLSCSVKSLVTMLWVGNTHRNTSPRKVRHPSVCGSLWERWMGGGGGRFLSAHSGLPKLPGCAGHWSK